jgi:putative addiction module component (TIGR02574 family)
MSPTIHDLGIDQLSAEDRLRLIGEIWDSLSRKEQDGIVGFHREELDRRLAEADANPAAGRPWEEVRTQLRSGQ